MRIAEIIRILMLYDVYVVSSTYIGDFMGLVYILPVTYYRYMRRY